MRAWLGALGVAALLGVACSADDAGDVPPGSGAASTETEGSTSVLPSSPSPPPSTPPPTASSPTTATRIDEADLAAEAYVWGYPLVVTQRTLQRFAQLIGVNRLFWQEELTGPETRLIVAPNRDTLYSVAVLDLRAEPQVLTVPDVLDRYWTYQLLDAWTESFAYVGTRATGGRGGTWAVTAPGWEGELPEGVEQIPATTPVVFLLGRFLVDDEADIANVQAIAQEVTLQPLSAVTGEVPPSPPPPLGEPVGTAQEVAKAGAAFYDELGDALAVHLLTTPAQQAELERFAPLGIGPGARPAADGPAELQAALAQGAQAGELLIDDFVDELVPVVNGWLFALDIGTYGGDAARRAAVARVGWGANVPEEAAYPLTLADANGEPLSGEHRYRLRFEAGQLPPVEAFWSLSLYGEDLFFVENGAGRYTIGDRTPGLIPNPDGSLDVWIQAEPPAEGTSNWLPAPAGRPFRLMMRLYLPGEPVLSGEWRPPPVTRIDVGG